MTIGFISDPWRWFRATVLLGVGVLAVLVWNPRFTIAGIWNRYERGSDVQQNKNAVCALFIGLAAMGCLESVRKHPATKTTPIYRAPWRQIWVHLEDNDQRYKFWVELTGGTFAEFDGMEGAESFIKSNPEMLKKSEI